MVDDQDGNLQEETKNVEKRRRKEVIMAGRDKREKQGTNTGGREGRRESEKRKKRRKKRKKERGEKRRKREPQRKRGMEGGKGPDSTRGRI